jgi:1,4-alpha-glucan branching enzyme
MKHNNKHKSKHGANGASTQAVHVKFTHPTASAVAIAGTFNDWRAEATPMVAMGDGRWLKQLVLPPGSYEYLFVADGQWLVDPLAKETVPNPFGGRNSVLIVPKPDNNKGTQKRSRGPTGTASW